MFEIIFSFNTNGKLAFIILIAFNIKKTRRRKGNEWIPTPLSYLILKNVHSYIVTMQNLATSNQNGSKNVLIIAGLI